MPQIIEINNQKHTFNSTPAFGISYLVEIQSEEQTNPGIVDLRTGYIYSIFDIEDTLNAYFQDAVESGEYTDFESDEQFFDFCSKNSDIADRVMSDIDSSRSEQEKAKNQIYSLTDANKNEVVFGGQRFAIWDKGSLIYNSKVILKK